MITTVEYFRLNEVLEKMVQEERITNELREELLHKAGLLKLDDLRWKMKDGSVLTFVK
jgi:hypothetical protein